MPFPAHGRQARRQTRQSGDADALTTVDLQTLLEAGRRLGREASSTGLVVLGEVGLANTTVASAICCALLDLDPDDAVGLGAGCDTAMLRRKVEVVTRALERFGRTAVPGPRDPIEVLQVLGGPEIAVLTGAVLGAAGAGACVVLDGLATSVAASVAARIEPAVTAYLVAGHRSRERAHSRVLTELGLEPLLDLRLRSGEGVGGCLAAGLLLQALTIRRGTGRVGPAASLGSSS